MSGVPAAPDARGPVVADTTPLITLAGVGYLDLLPSLYSQIWIPEAVRDEYRTGQKSGEPAIGSLPWLRVRPVIVAATLSPQLDAGEAAAISLALSAHARLVLIDERSARREAQRLGLPVAGSLAVLIEAKARGLLPELAPILDAMVIQGRHISEQLRERALHAAGEDGDEGRPRP